MKRKYTTPIIEITNDIMEDCIMLPASVSGHTDEALTRVHRGDEQFVEAPSLSRSQGFDLWEE